MIPKGIVRLTILKMEIKIVEAYKLQLKKFSSLSFEGGKVERDLNTSRIKVS